MAPVLARKRSPRAPSAPLSEALDQALKIYEKESCHSTPVDVAAGHLGYKGAANGSASMALATLRYYGLIERPKEGFLNVTRDVEAFKYAPDEEARRKQIRVWLRNPQIFSDILDKYPGGLPSDKTIKYDLIQKGFAPSAADICVSAFLSSVEYAKYFDDVGFDVETKEDSTSSSDASGQTGSPDSGQSQTVAVLSSALPVVGLPLTSPTAPVPSDVDRIPVRLAGGRRAWIEVPTPFYKADKKRLIDQIQLLLTEDEEEGGADR